MVQDASELGLGFGGTAQPCAAPARLPSHESAPTSPPEPSRSACTPSLQTQIDTRPDAQAIEPPSPLALPSPSVPRAAAAAPSRTPLAAPSWTTTDLRHAAHTPDEPVPAGSIVCRRDGSILLPVHADGGAGTRPVLWAALHPVTNAQYACFQAAAGRSDSERLGTALLAGDHPATGVTYADALAYCEWSGLSLPTWEEWRLLAGGLEQCAYPWGDTWTDGAECRWFGNRDGRSTASVYAYPAGRSPWGLYGCSGNVEEWCAASADGPSRDGAVMRHTAGGSWRSCRPRDLLCATPAQRLGHTRTSYVGFRPIFRACRTMEGDLR